MPPLVYDQLRQLAARRMVHEMSGQTLQPTVQITGTSDRTVRRQWNYAERVIKLCLLQPAGAEMMWALERYEKATQRSIAFDNPNSERSMAAWCSCSLWSGFPSPPRTPWWPVSSA